MSRARNLADVISGSYDVPLAALDNVPPSNDASALTTGTLPIARIADGTVTSDKLASNAAATNINGTAVNITLDQNGTYEAGNFFGSARGRTIDPTESWQTFAVLPSATAVGARLKVISGHNSGVNTYYEANHDTYAYNIGNGTVVNFTTGTGIGTVQVRKVKNNSYGGDGGWDYQIKKSNPQGVQVWIELFGADSSWRWYK